MCNFSPDIRMYVYAVYSYKYHFPRLRSISLLIKTVCPPSHPGPLHYTIEIIAQAPVKWIAQACFIKKISGVSVNSLCSEQCRDKEESMCWSAWQPWSPRSVKLQVHRPWLHDWRPQARMPWVPNARSLMPWQLASWGFSAQQAGGHGSTKRECPAWMTSRAQLEIIS